MSLTTHPGDNAHAPRVLIAGGQPDLRHMISATLRMAGYQVVSADSDHTVFSLAQAFHPDLVIVDLKFGRLNTHSAQERLEYLNRFSEFPVIVVSQEDDPVVMDICLQAGANDFLAMPFTPTLLEQRITQLVG